MINKPTRRFSFYAVFNKHGFSRARKTKPSVTGNDFGVLITIEIPESWFEPKPMLKYEIKVDSEKPEIKIPNPQVIKNILYNNGIDVDIVKIENKEE